MISSMRKHPPHQHDNVKAVGSKSTKHHVLSYKQSNAGYKSFVRKHQLVTRATDRDYDREIIEETVST